MKDIDLAKRDMTVAYGNRTFVLRAYLDDGAWHGIIIENKTPLRNAVAPAVDAASCFAASVAFIAAVVESAAGARI
jgi:hypothetical protein